MTRILLVSSSLYHGGSYLKHCEKELLETLEGVGRLLFIPYALKDRDKYAEVAQRRFEELGIEVDSIHRMQDKLKALDEAQAVFAGGGNTFVLLRRLQRHGLLDAIKKRVAEGMPYIGSSAGANVAGVSIQTTNDMPIVEVKSLAGIGLVPFNINPHYVEEGDDWPHNGEKRAERIQEFHSWNSIPVVAMFEGASLRVEGPKVEVRGEEGAWIFRQGTQPVHVDAGASLSSLHEDLQAEG